MHRTEAINFNWKYTPGFQPEYLRADHDDSKWECVHVPHANVELPFNNFDQELYQLESCYRKVVRIEDLPADVVLFAHFEGVMAYARVYLNGSFLGEHQGGYTGFRVDLTPAVRRAADNLLAVYVDAREGNDFPPFGHMIDYLTYGGIYREVSLEYRRRTHLASALVRPRGAVGGDAVVDVDLRFCHGDGAAARVQCDFALACEGQTVGSCQRELELDAAADQLRRLTIPAGEVHLWDLDDPVLYELRIRLTKAGAALGDYVYRFGFRDIDFRKDGFFLNGRRVKLRGLNRHQSFPYVGYALPKRAQYRDAEILKHELGVNAVRSSHYPPSRHFLDRCDELGLLVFEEVPGWQFIGGSEWKRTLLRNLEEMILTDGNHPCVFIWGVRINESQDDDALYARTNARARELDPSRPTGGVRCFTGSSLLEDVYAYNDFHHTGDNQGLKKPRKVVGKKAPYLVTEHNGHVFPVKKYDDEAQRLAQAKRHLKVLDAAYADNTVSGAMGWCMFDYNTHRDFGSGDMVCYHGVLDMFRIPKPAAAAYAAQDDGRPVLQVASTMNIGENEGSLLADVYVFTNLESVKMYKGGELVREFFPRRDAYPHLPHPPVIVDDFVGDAIEKNEKFSRRDARTVKELLTKFAKNGGDLGFVDSLRMGRLFLKYRMNYQHGEDLYTKYFGGWGDAARSYAFEGWAGGRCVKRVTFDRDSSPVLRLELDDTKLTEAETYDVTRCVVRLTDRDGNDLVHGHDAFTVAVEGPIEVIGPRVLSLVGGSVGFWVKTTGVGGAAKVIVASERFGNLVRELTVHKVDAKTAGEEVGG